MPLDTNAPKFYRHSGKIPLTAWLNLALVVCVLVPLLAYGYAWIIRYSNNLAGDFFEVANPIFAGLFGFGIAWLANKLVIRKGRVRHPRFALLVGMGVAFWAFYVHWVFWVEMVVTGHALVSPWANLTQPTLLWSRVVEINSTGTWVSFFRSDVPMPVGGWVLSMLWAFEFVLIAMFAPYRCFFHGRAPFCESRQEWYEKLALPEMQSIGRPLDWIATMEADPESAVAKMEVARRGTVNTFRMTLYQLGSEQVFLSVELWSKTISGLKGLEFADCVEISERLRQVLLSHADLWRAAAAQPEPPPDDPPDA